MQDDVVNLARLELKDEKTLELIGLIEQRVKKLDSVIADFLQLSRAKKSEVKLNTLSLNQLIDEVKQIARVSRHGGQRR